MSRLPTAFVSHGSPMVLIEPGPSHDFLKRLADELPRPKAIVSVTAHWITHVPTLSTTAQPETLYDFGGFPDELYTLTYPAPGAPELAERAAQLLGQANIEFALKERRAFDHGTWVPLMLGYPQADIPVLELSVQPRENARWHFDLGLALAPLRDEGVLIVGSGSLTHNLMAMDRSGHPEPLPWVMDFTTWVRSAIAEKRWDDLIDYENLAPHWHENHPTPEHFLPLFVALGAAADTGSPPCSTIMSITARWRWMRIGSIDPSSPFFVPFPCA